jgi:hypothetical protein
MLSSTIPASPQLTCVNDGFPETLLKMAVAMSKPFQDFIRRRNGTPHLLADDAARLRLEEGAMDDEAAVDGVISEAIRTALDTHLAAASQDGGSVSVGRIVQELQTASPDSGLSPVALAEAVLRAASARGLVVMIG